MGEWSNATYLQCDDLERVERQVCAAFAAEGRALIPAPGPRVLERNTAMQYAGALGSDLWAVALLPGRSGWTMVRTAPWDLLTERAQGASAPRLAALTTGLDCVGLAYNLYDGSQDVLVECTSNGRYAMSGFAESPGGGDPMVYYGEPHGGDPHAQVYWRLLDPDSVIGAGDTSAAASVLRALVGSPHPEYRQEPWGVDIARALADTLGGPNGQSGDNEVLIQLVRHAPIALEGARVLYFRRQPAQ